MHKKIDEILLVQKEIIGNAYMIIDDLSFLSNENHSQEIMRVLNSDRFFNRMGEYMWIVLILELSYLYSKKEDYSFEKLLSKIQSNSEINIDKDNFDKLKKIVCNNKHQEVVNRLKIIRDKSTAHLDLKRLKEIIEINLDEIKLLIKQSEEIFSKINLLLGRADTSFDNIILGKCENTLKKLAKQYKK